MVSKRDVTTEDLQEYVNQGIYKNYRGSIATNSGEKSIKSQKTGYVIFCQV